MCMVGVTGTNGKTTTTYLIENMLQCARKTVGVIGTINYRYAGRKFDNPVTTPESVDLHRILSEMADHGVTHVVMEISSHAIDLHRIDHCRFDVAVFTNLSQDHLDYHRDMETYWACKKRLFTHHLAVGSKKNSATAVINCLDPRGLLLCGDLPVPVVRVGRIKQDAVAAEKIRFDLKGIHGTIRTPAGTLPIDSRLIGEHNLENILCAAGAGVALGLPQACIREGISATRSIPGRLEPVDADGPVHVFVDYAHTPDALMHVLSVLRTFTQRRIICVFGCGGDRDQKKRPLMGKIAGGTADLSVITSDNPRSENPMDIIAQIVEGVDRAGARPLASPGGAAGPASRRYIVIPDRREAIRYGIAAASTGDVVPIAGKGHENYQILGEEIIDFDDRKEAARILAARSGGRPE